MNAIPSSLVQELNTINWIPYNSFVPVQFKIIHRVVNWRLWSLQNYPTPSKMTRVVNEMRITLKCEILTYINVLKPLIDEPLSNSLQNGKKEFS